MQAKFNIRRIMIEGKKVGLALSGGGYRAAAYHIGALRALYKLGVIDKVDVISSVSGGSIVAAYYGLHGGSYDSFEKEFSEKIQEGVLTWSLINLFVILVVVGIVSWIFGGWGFFGALVLLWFAWYKVLPVSSIIAWEYDKLFFHGKKLSDLPKEPLVTINATDYPTVPAHRPQCPRCSRRTCPVRRRRHHHCGFGIRLYIFSSEALFYQEKTQE